MLNAPDLGYRQCYWNDQDDSTNQGSAAEADTNLEEQTREGSGELHWLGWQDCWQRSGVCECSRVDENMFWAAGVAEGKYWTLIGWLNEILIPDWFLGPQESHQKSHSQHLRLHRQGHRSSRRVGHASQQPQGPGETEQSVHNGNICFWLVELTHTNLWLVVRLPLLSWLRPAHPSPCSLVWWMSTGRYCLLIGWHKQ